MRFFVALLTLYNNFKEWEQFLQQLHLYIWRYGIVHFEDHHLGGRTTKDGIIEEYDEYFPKEATGNLSNK